MKCPGCGDPVTVEGKLSKNDQGGFRPDGLRFFTFARNVALRRYLFVACTGCGLVWNKLDPAELRRMIDESGSAELLAELRRKAGVP
jgi:hypothetical protein